MGRKFKKVISFLIAAAIIASLCVIPASADNANIKCSTTVYVGETFTVTVTCSSDSSSGLGSVDGLLSYNSNNFQCTSNPANTSYSAADKGYIIAYQNLSDASKISKDATFTFKFKALKAVKDSFVINAEITSFDEASVNKKENIITVTAIEKKNLSGNANLAKLITSSGALTPKFDPKITNYTVKVPYSVTTVYMNASTEEDAATIDVEGGSKVKVGNNVRKITVTAPNGTKKIYTLTVYRAKDGEDVNSKPTSSQTDSAATSSGEPKNPYQITVDNEKRLVAGDFSSVVLPDGFKQTYITINDAEVPAVIDPVNNKTLVYATDEEGNNGEFYSYDREKGTFALYRYFKTKAARFVILDCENKNAPYGYYYTTTKIEGYSCGCFKYSDPDFANYSILYCETADGLKDYYRYDKTDGSMQRNREFSVLMAESEGKEPTASKSFFTKFAELDVKGKIVVISVILIIILLIVIVIIMIVRTIKAKRALMAPPPVPDNEMPGFLEGVDDTRDLYLGDYDDYDDGDGGNTSSEDEPNPIK
ncbi:MAG: cadherin-like beta sandwich domain-containing protein [Clostridiales bacterium]|nr:cadherin-like beta sandwich domain-containing protein [Candidatus Equinaster intestinalis]